MKNVYEMRGDVVAIRLRSRRHGDQFAIIDVADLERTRAFDGPWYYEKPPSSRTGYAVANTKYITGRIGMVLLHRWLLNPPADLEIDHINRNGLDNRRCNLRVVSHWENLQNRHDMSAVGHRGVYWDQYDKRYVAQIRAKGKRYRRSSSRLERAIELRHELESQYGY